MKWLFKQFYRIQLASIVLNLLTLAFSVIAASNVIMGWLEIKTTRVVLILIIPIGLLLIWAIGWFLDVKIEAQRRQEEQLIERSIIWRKAKD